jgi:3-hydroxyisobutyrate dehydrogenase-like beta-hydroxyacid dehydrogenase
LRDHSGQRSGVGARTTTQARGGHHELGEGKRPGLEEMARQVVRVGEEKQRKKEGKRRIKERGKRL